MTAVEKHGGMNQTDYVSMMQYGDAHHEGSSLPQDSRRRLYDKYADPRIGLVNGIYRGIDGKFEEALDLQGCETLVDVCTGDARFPRRLIEDGHTGLVVGINKPATHFVGNKDALEFEGRRNVVFFEADARRLGLADESCDVVTQKFCHYHIEDAWQVTDEGVRILKPGGKLAIATRDDGNQRQIWDNLGLVAEELRAMSDRGEAKINEQTGEQYDYSSIQAPVSWYGNFDTAKVIADLERVGLTFDEEKDVYRQSTRLGNSVLRLVATTANDIEDVWLDYLYAHTAFYTAFEGVTPRATDMVRAMNKVIFPRFVEEANNNGFVKVDVEQSFVVAKKDA